MYAPSIIIYVQELLVVQNDMSAPPILILVVHLHHRHHQDRRPCLLFQEPFPQTAATQSTGLLTAFGLLMFVGFSLLVLSLFLLLNHLRQTKQVLSVLAHRVVSRLRSRPQKENRELFWTAKLAISIERRATRVNWSLLQGYCENLDKNSSRDEIANVNFSTTTANMYRPAPTSVELTC